MHDLRMSAATAAKLHAMAEALLWDGEDIAADAIYASIETCKPNSSEAVILSFRK